MKHKSSISTELPDSNPSQEVNGLTEIPKPLTRDSAEPRIHNREIALIAKYSRIQPDFEQLAEIVRNTLENLIKDNHIEYLSITARAKSVDSFQGKLERKEYANPLKEMHDLAGVRVITYVQSEADKVADLVRSIFDVHPYDSLDKSTELGVDRVGYRSLHFVCELGQERIALPEYARYKNRVFEVQVRTVLQHAWAEIEHDRYYKFGSVLPEDFQRRFSLAAANLESVDREFNNLAREIDDYETTVARDTRAGKLGIDLNTTSLAQFVLSDQFVKKGWIHEPVFSIGSLDAITKELRDFGITTLSALDTILTLEFIVTYNKHTSSEFVDDLSILSLFRAAMMYSDIEKYFDIAWEERWDETESDTLIPILAEKYGMDRVTSIMNAHSIRMYPRG